MKKITAFILALLCVASLLCFVGCKREIDEGVWNDAIYKEDTTIGEGSKTVQIEVKIGEKSVTLTVNTDETNLGKILLNNGIIEGEQGAYGIYIKKVNGIFASWEDNRAYWVYYKGGEYASSGVDQVTIADGDHYEFVYTVE